MNVDGKIKTKVQAENTLYRKTILSQGLKHSIA